MDYALAKGLKEAGFPQNTLFSYVFHESHMDGSPLGVPELVPSHSKKEDWDTYVAAPILSELIDASGEITISKKRDAPCEDIQVDTYTYCAYTDNLDFVGATPEEAVANLWLALNKKGSDFSGLKDIVDDGTVVMNVSHIMRGDKDVCLENFGEETEGCKKNK